MSKITDPDLVAIVEGFSTGGLSVPTARALHRVAHLLLAAHSLDDISVFAGPQTGVNGRLVVPVSGKWAISFVMANAGPDDLRLEKIAKSCPAEPSRSSRLPRPGKS